MRLLFIADLVGDDAVSLVVDILPRLKNFYGIDFTIVNGENADKGKGITVKQVKRLQGAGVDCLTSGNHIWDPRKRDVLVTFSGYLLRPLNYPEGNVGLGSSIFKLPDGRKVGVLNLQGRSFMYSIDCPFRIGEKELRKLRSETNILRQPLKNWPWAGILMARLRLLLVPTPTFKPQMNEFSPKAQLI